MFFESLPKGEMDARAVIEIIVDKANLFYRKGRKVFCKNANYLTTKNTKKTQGSQSFK